MNSRNWWILGGVVIVVLIIGVIIWNVPAVNRQALRDEVRNNQLNNSASSTPLDNGNPNPIVNPGPNPAPQPPQTIDGPIAYIGCSNTWQIVRGYHDNGGTKFWQPDSNYGGGTATVWGSNVTNSSPYWQEFDKLNAQDPGAKNLWFMICIKSRDDYTTSYNSSVALINQARLRIPTIQNVYVTALNDFTDDCSEVGTTGVPNSKQTAATLIANGLAKAGPVLSTLGRADTTDGCHPNPNSRLLQGNELLSFFK